MSCGWREPAVCCPMDRQTKCPLLFLWCWLREPLQLMIIDHARSLVAKCIRARVTYNGRQRSACRTWYVAWILGWPIWSENWLRRTVCPADLVQCTLAWSLDLRQRRSEVNCGCQIGPVRPISVGSCPHLSCIKSKLVSKVLTDYLEVVAHCRAPVIARVHVFEDVRWGRCLGCLEQVRQPHEFKEQCAAMVKEPSAFSCSGMSLTFPASNDHVDWSACSERCRSDECNIVWPGRLESSYSIGRQESWVVVQQLAYPCLGRDSARQDQRPRRRTS